MSLYERWCWAPLLEYAMRQEPVMQERRKVVPRAIGRVLEVGVGSGLNLGLYDRERVDRVWALDPSHTLLARAQARTPAEGVEVRLLAGSAEEIPFSDSAFDTVVSTFTMCSIPNLTRALGEIRRVLRRGGRLLFSEHGLSPDAPVARWQRWLSPCWCFLSGGCNVDRGIEQSIEGAGFRLLGVDAAYLPGPRMLTYTSTGTAARGN
jgi:ubiquinone/menaquinone biosynthesis C-methylase UbiE